jgi:hypothetical protein
LEGKLKSDKRDGEPACPARRKSSPGKRKKNSTLHTFPTISTLRTGNHQAGWEEIKVYAAVGSTETGPKDTRNAETSSAIRSSERRKKMSVPTANHAL